MVRRQGMWINEYLYYYYYIDQAMASHGNGPTRGEEVLELNRQLIEELKRIGAVVAHLAEELTVPLSVDTYKATVAARAVELGAVMINDIWGLQNDPGMAAAVADATAGAGAEWYRRSRTRTGPGVHATARGASPARLIAACASEEHLAGELARRGSGVHPVTRAEQVRRLNPLIGARRAPDRDRSRRSSRSRFRSVSALAAARMSTCR